jgi:hypothetical protein
LKLRGSNGEPGHAQHHNFARGLSKTPQGSWMGLKSASFWFVKLDV